MTLVGRETRPGEVVVVVAVAKKMIVEVIQRSARTEIEKKRNQTSGLELARRVNGGRQIRPAASFLCAHARQHHSR